MAVARVGGSCTIGDYTVAHMIRPGTAVPASPQLPFHKWIQLVSILTLAACGPVRPVPIFLWHSVGEGAPNDRYDVSVDEFEQQLQMLNDQNIKTVTLDQVLSDWEGRTPLPAKAVVLTFDDGRQCLHDQVMPALLRHGAVGELFLVTGYLAETAAERKIVINALGRHPYLTWPEVQEMVGSGAFVAESHTVDHPALRKLSERQQQHQIVESRRELQRRLGIPVRYFAYPYGAFNPTTVDIVEQAGYRAALSVGKGNNSRYQITRHSVWPSSTQQFQAVLKETFGGPSSR